LDSANEKLVKVLRIAGVAEIDLIYACASVEKLHVYQVAVPLGK
jgi:hypothetical protein